ncbi:hypothetical protein UPYG_G00059740 [Umbra pygmaea]|uniref:B-cell receptor CD22 n=1 Tax=Umbra pygmaea TaxID=75934 RepID=A0ABD0XP33_UMBPY
MGNPGVNLKFTGINCWSVTYTHQSICAFKGTTVDIPCSYIYPSDHEVNKTFWFTKWEYGKEPEDLSLDPAYEGRIEYRGDKKNESTLRITDLRLTDTAQYRFRFITTRERFAGTPVYLNITDGPKNTSVSVSPSGEIVEGSSVTLTCSSDVKPPVDKYTWYKKNVTSPKASGQSYSITNIRSEASGEYYCEAENECGCFSSSSVSVDVQCTSVFPWVTVVGVGSVLTAAALLLTIYCILRRRCTGGSGATAETQSVHPDSNSDTYTALNMKNRSPVYDTLTLKP